MSRRFYIKPEYKKFVEKLNIGQGKYNIRIIFQDLILMATIAIKNRYDYSQEDENVYLRIINKYEKQEQKQFVELLSMLFMLYMEQNKITDILGEIYQSVGLANGHMGQFFTPVHIAEMIGKSIVSSQEIEKKKCFTVYDPCCGSGVLLLGFVAANRDKIENFSDKVVFFAKDIDFNCVCMTFIQLTMNKIPAKVVLGDALLEDERKILYTPEFIKRDWFEKLKNEVDNTKN